jgi:NADP-dependent 3-hydroxy acid dehydrogenase YdfG
MSKVWFITGAGSGIGAGTVKAAVKAGHRVVATARNVEKLHAALSDIPIDENLQLLQLDVTDQAQAQSAIDQAVARFGRIDALVNNAGYCLLGNFEELQMVDIHQQFATNLWGVMYVMRAALPVMRNSAVATSLT